MVITTFTDLLGTNDDEIYQGSEMFIYRSSVFTVLGLVSPRKST